MRQLLIILYLFLFVALDSRAAMTMPRQPRRGGMSGQMGGSYGGMTPAQMGQMNVMAQMGPNADYMANMTGQTGTLGAMGFKAKTGITPMMGVPGQMNPMAGMNPMGGMGMGGMPGMPGMMGGMGMPGMMGGMMNPQMMVPGMMQEMMKQSPQYIKLQAKKTAASYRIVKNVTNGALAGKTRQTLTKYQTDLQELVGLSPEYMPASIDPTDIDLQLSRVNLALTDKNTLLFDPNSMTLPDNRLRQERRTRLNALLAKWSTPEGVAPSGSTRTRRSSMRTRSTRSGTGLASFVKTRAQIELISADERQLSVAKTEVEEEKNRDTLRRIENAIYNTIIAKGKAYDSLMDTMTKQDWGQIIDAARGHTTISTTGRTARTSTRGPTRISSKSRGTRRTARTRGPSQFGRDEIAELREEIRGVLDELEKRPDGAVGDDRALRKTLEIQEERLDQVLEAMEDISLPNPFQAQSPVLKQVSQVYQMLIKMTDQEIMKIAPAQLLEYRDAFDAAILTPENKLPKDLTYSRALSMYYKLSKMIAVKEFLESDQDRKSISQGSSSKRAIGRFSRDRGEGRNDVTNLVDYLKRGDFDRGAPLSVSMMVSRLDVTSLVKRLNEKAILGDEAEQAHDAEAAKDAREGAKASRSSGFFGKIGRGISRGVRAAKRTASSVARAATRQNLKDWRAIAAQQDRRKAARIALTNLVQDLRVSLKEVPSISMGTYANKVSRSRLRGTHDDLSDYYLNGDCEIWPLEGDATAEDLEVKDQRRKVRVGRGGAGAKVKAVGAFKAAGERKATRRSRIKRAFSSLRRGMKRKKGAPAEVDLESKIEEELKESKEAADVEAGDAPEPGGEKKAPREMGVQTDSAEEKVETEKRKSPEEEAMDEILQSESLLGQIIQKVEGALASNFKASSLRESWIKDNLDRATNALQEALHYQYSGFLSNAQLSDIQAYTEKLTSLLESVIAEEEKASTSGRSRDERRSSTSRRRSR